LGDRAGGDCGVGVWGPKEEHCYIGGNRSAVKAPILSSSAKICFTLFP
jgi:hypothetical protein